VLQKKLIKDTSKVPALRTGYFAKCKSLGGSVVGTPVFFNLFAAADPYISVKNPHGIPWHVMISESNGVGKVKFSGFGNQCLQQS